LKKILFIDLESVPGHLNFNKLFIDYLTNKNSAIDLVCSYDYFNKINHFNSNKIIYNVDNLNFSYSNKLFYRLHILIILFKLKIKIFNKKYDEIIFSNFDEVSLYFSGFYKKCSIVDHGNLADSQSNSIKKLFLKKISKHSTLIVFNEMILDRAKEFGFKKCILINQGLSPPIKIERIISIKKILKLDSPNYIFFPHFSKFGSKKELEIFNTKLNEDFLNKNNLYIIYKSEKKPDFKSSRHIYLDLWIDYNLYKNIFISAKAIFLLYPESFSYRVSAILLEAFSNNIPIFLSKIDSFKYYKPFFNYDPYVDENDIDAKLKQFFSKTPTSFYKDLNKLKFGKQN